MVYAQDFDFNQNQLKTNRELAKAQLAALGYKSGSEIFLRAFFPSGDPRSSSDKGRKADSLDFNLIESWQREGRGVYFVVNGGGHSNDQVTSCRAIFYEHDNLDKETQLYLWESLGLPEPTIQVDTGGKSIHSYWVFDSPIPVENWKQLQTDLLEFADGDRSIKNPSRVMRLAGAWHIKGDGTVNQSQIVSNSGQRYSEEELRKIVPHVEVKQPQPPAQKKHYQHPSPQEKWTEIDWALSYLNALQPRRADDYENWLAVGMALKSANESLLAEWESWSQQSSKYKPSECEKKWNSFKSAGVNLGTLAHFAKQDGWQSPFLKPDLPTGKKFQSKSTAGSGGGSGQPPINQLSLRDCILEILARGLSPAEQKVAFIDLKKSMGEDLKTIEDLARLLEHEADSTQERLEIKKAIPSLLECQKAQLNPDDLFWGDGGKLAKLLSSVAKGMPTAVETLITTLIPVAGSRIGTNSRIVINPQSRYTQPAIYRTCIVAESGRKKTPAQKIIIDPLDALEAKEYRKWKSDSDDYQAQLKISKKNDSLPDTPSPRQRYIILNGSIESRIKIHSENPRGLLLYKDEWSAHLTSRNKYRSGKGDDAEIELSEFNGGSLSKDVVDDQKCLYLESSAISRTGSTQTDTLKGLMNDHSDTTGEFARWLFCMRPSPPAYIDLFSEDDSGEKLADYLNQIYQLIGQLPKKDYLLDNSAKAVFQCCQHQLVDWTLAETDIGLKTAYPKFESYFGRFALWLHLVNSVLAGATDPQQYIGAETVATAWAMVEFYITQLKLVYALNSPQQVSAGRILKIKEFITQRTEGVEVRTLKSGCRILRKVPTHEIRNDLMILVDAGEIIFKDKKYYPSSSTVVDATDGLLTGRLTQHQQSETMENQYFASCKSKLVDVVDDVRATEPKFGNSSFLDLDSQHMDNSDSYCVNSVNPSSLFAETIDQTTIQSVDTERADLLPASTASTSCSCGTLSPKKELAAQKEKTDLKVEQVPPSQHMASTSINTSAIPSLSQSSYCFTVPSPYQVGQLIKVVHEASPYKGVVILITFVKVSSMGVYYVGTIQRAPRRSDRKREQWMLSHNEVELVQN